MAPRAEPTAVVGWGSLNPLAADADSTWKAVIAGRSGIQTLQAPWAEDLPVRLAGCVPTGALDSLPPLLRRWPALPCSLAPGLDLLPLPVSPAPGAPLLLAPCRRG